MRFIIPPIGLLLMIVTADARVYRCEDGTGVTYQQTPCAAPLQEPPAAATQETAPAAGFDAACTHYNGRRVLPLAEVSALPEVQRDDYLEWLLSDEAPTKEEKQACLTGRREAKGEADAAAQAQQAQAKADRDALAAIEAYGLFRTFARQISVCRDLDAAASDAAQDLLDRYLSEAAELHAEGRRLARVGVSVGGREGSELSPTQIEQGIRDAEQAITERFAGMTPANRAELEAECGALAGLIEFQLSLAGS